MDAINTNNMDSKAHVLFSGGKDSSLSAIILNNLGYDIELVTINFGVLDSYIHAQNTAKILNYSHKVISLDSEILEKSVDIILNDGFPSNGIQYIHKETLNIISDDFEVIADGTRRDDRVPKLSHAEVQSLEMRKNIQYITPLMGFGHKTLRNLVNNYFEISEKESEELLKSDYETEIRAVLRSRGENPLDYFPKHIQSRVVGLKKR
ncbi:putative subunit of tRNA(5-methylaminomethyl-2-thiouridylate) methyltransferase [Methanococcus voltae]|uniref:DUF7411 family protein n=1 Tax=Methanococcus voltae TaxID=2188 RepID=UPI001FD9BBEC|nr:hypothetical protein [Methanococcus voltae]MBP2143786.1 putative subunit of tRNA(5-methylaminomethyl-2-thiouridylate) methyltransferase [Methanococcus voltae]